MKLNQRNIKMKCWEFVHVILSYLCQNISLKGLFLLPTQASMAREPREPINTAHCLLSRWFIYLFCQIVSKERHYQTIVIEHTHTQQTNYQLILSQFITWHWSCVHSLTPNQSTPPAFPPVLVMPILHSHELGGNSSAKLSIPMK